ncbi:uncharacterized protein [Apostichopus japonicus]
MTFLLCLVMLQYVCHAKSACSNRHPKLCILHPGKRGYISAASSNDRPGNENGVSIDRTEFTQPKWLHDELTKSGELENLFGQEQEEDIIPFNDDRLGYTQDLLTKVGIDHLERREQILRILTSLLEDDLSYRR